MGRQSQYTSVVVCIRKRNRQALNVEDVTVPRQGGV